jgi:colanic acid biosynthesis glycosyl transferase WcaI
MKKRFLLIGYNFSPEPTGIGKYSGEMISWLMNQGYDCTVITSYPYYPYWKVQEPYHKKRFWYSVEETEDQKSGGRLTVIRCPQFVPSKPSGFKRILLDFSFSFSTCLPVLQLLFQKKFDYVMTVAPSFQIGLFCLLFRKLRNSKFLYHIQDLQIEAAQDLGMIRSRTAIDMLLRIEKFILNGSDVVSTISPSMVAKVRQKIKREVVLFPNWTDVNAFYPITNKSEIKKKYSYKETDKIILYSGAIGEKQGLDTIIKIADDLRDHTNLKFIICGSGPYKKDLEAMAASRQLENLNFMPLQPFEEFNNFLNLADVHLVIQKAGATDLVMPSKLTTILSVGGLAIITATEGSGLFSLVKQHNIGVLADAENSASLKESILTVISRDHSHISSNARKYAVEYLSTDKILGSYEDAIQNGKIVYGGSPKFSRPAVRLGHNMPGVPDSKAG